MNFKQILLSTLKINEYKDISDITTELFEMEEGTLIDIDNNVAIRKNHSYTIATMIGSSCYFTGFHDKVRDPIDIKELLIYTKNSKIITQLVKNILQQKNDKVNNLI